MSFSDPSFASDSFNASSLLEALNPKASYYKEFSKHLLSGALNAETLNWVRSNFKTINSSDGLITGYYLPRIKGSLKESKSARYPIYAPTPDSKFSRQEIEAGKVLQGKNLEIAWVDDVIDLFFVHIQGYGILELEDGSTIMLQKAGNNGHAYFPIGKIFLERNLIEKEKISMQSIKSYLRANPEDVDLILHTNPRYIFFSIQERGPVGSSGSILVPFRSVATDLAHYPENSLLYNHKNEIIAEKPVSFFAVNHDTGSAIIGKGRVDLYCGDDENTAGHLKSQGKVFLLDAC
jgi:membrane-bound lytic murein transglycosylase A